ncbi:MAG: hypothetical protein QHJ73_05250, partial [Armatimonadota bacterium]|nr:hypothetical protein [Armatimonadota bacterium]
FAADLSEALELTPSRVEAALTELVLAGLATNDSVEALRHFLSGGTAASGATAPFSSLESQLAQRHPPGSIRIIPRRDRAAYHAAKRRVAERVRPSSASRWVGRWSLVHRFAVMGRPASAEERALRHARQLLHRWGVVTRAAFDAEEQPWDWAGILEQLRLMEMRGELRRGYFVEGLPGMQFALPEVVEHLRALRDAPADTAAVVLNACDPANLYGRVEEPAASTPAHRPLVFARLPSTYLAQWRGVPVLLAESLGAALTTSEGVEGEVLANALEALFAHLLRTEPRVTVRTWNDAPILESDGAPLLERLGFYREPAGMTRDRAV